MGNPSRNRSFLSTVTALLVTGLGIGWLAGLSVSPVISVVITSVTGSIAAIVAALSGLDTSNLHSNEAENKTRRRIHADPIPLAILVIGLIFGSLAGIYIRTRDLLSPQPTPAPTISDEIKQWTDAKLTNETEIARRIFENRYAYRGWLGPDLSAEIQKWTDAGIAKDEVVQRLFQSTYPLEIVSGTVVTSTQPERPAHQLSVLYGTMTDACSRLSVYLQNTLPNDDEFIKNFESEVATTPFAALWNKLLDKEMFRQSVAEFCTIMQPATP